MFPTKIDLAEETRNQVMALLNARLADAIDLQSQAKQAHWIAKGPHFIALHEMFNKISEDAEEYVDDIAKRVIQLRGVTEGSDHGETKLAYGVPFERGGRSQRRRGVGQRRGSVRRVTSKGRYRRQRLSDVDTRAFSPRSCAGSTIGCGWSNPTGRPSDDLGTSGTGSRIWNHPS